MGLESWQELNNLKTLIQRDTNTEEIEMVKKSYSGKHMKKSDLRMEKDKKKFYLSGEY